MCRPPPRREYGLRKLACKAAKRKGREIAVHIDRNRLSDQAEPRAECHSDVHAAGRDPPATSAPAVAGAVRHRRRVHSRLPTLNPRRPPRPTADAGVPQPGPHGIRVKNHLVRAACRSLGRHGTVPCLPHDLWHDRRYRGDATILHRSRLPRGAGSRPARHHRPTLRAYWNLKAGRYPPPPLPVRRIPMG